VSLLQSEDIIELFQDHTKLAINDKIFTFIESNNEGKFPEAIRSK
jgi:hypothetical protein